MRLGILYVFMRVFFIFISFLFACSYMFLINAYMYPYTHIIYI